ncbi:MAG: toll/interleukin-1 receptor domain-containing protein [Bryobacteraceae bacterium]|jgi:TIR domain-containing protein
MSAEQPANGIFISYVHEDHDLAAGIGDFLRSQGYKTVFFTGNDWLLYAGELWLDRIREELTSAKVVLCLFSQCAWTGPGCILKQAQHG